MKKIQKDKTRLKSEKKGLEKTLETGKKAFTFIYYIFTFITLFSSKINCLYWEIRQEIKK